MAQNKAGSPANTQRKRGTLTKKEVAIAACRLIEEKGVEACSMRALGNVLGVSAMALYGYYPSHEAVMNAVCERLLNHADTRPIPGERWDDTLYRTMTSLYELCREKPFVADVMNHPEVGIGLEGYMMRLRKLFVEQCMPEPIAIQVVAMADAYVAGFLSRSRQRVVKEGEQEHAIHEPVSRVQGLLTGRIPDRGPDEHWRKTVKASYGDRSFENGLFIIAEGVRAGAEPDPCEWRTPSYKFQGL